MIWDVLWSALSVFLVYLYVLYHTKSLFVTSTSMSTILLSFPVTLVVYKLIMGISNLSTLHLMVTFVVLGVSTDNIFVVWDAWIQSDTYP
jgi:hypothetical protein